MPKGSPDFLEILRALTRHEVDFIIVGGVCGVLHGAPLATLVLPLVHSRSEGNVERLLAALASLDAYHREHKATRLKSTASHLAGPGPNLLATRCGSLDLLGEIVGRRGYEDLLAETVLFEIEPGSSVRALSLPALIAVKEATARDTDMTVLPVLRQTLEEQKRREGQGADAV